MDDEERLPGMRELDDIWSLMLRLRDLRNTDSENGRLWAIAATESEKLYAWIAHVVWRSDLSNDGPEKIAERETYHDVQADS